MLPLVEEKVKFLEELVAKIRYDTVEMVTRIEIIEVGLQ